MLKGRVAVAGEGLYVAARQLSHILTRSREIEDRFVDGEFTFTVDPVNAPNYLFTFDNTAGDAESHVAFVLDETRTGSPFELLMWSLPYPIRSIFFLLAVLLLACVLPVGWMVIVWHFIRRRRRARLRKLALRE